ncbi:MAG: flagellar biosynthetic protein FliO, partial [Lachnospiraceae bacterium]|nr:flagellar biosynthetic protein FliO [Lachnospiraceae bacterium]
IVRIADEYLALCVCKDTVTFLTKVDKEQLKLTADGTAERTDYFADILDKAKRKAETMRGKREDK